jgi:hypothetical protein
MQQLLWYWMKILVLIGITSVWFLVIELLLMADSWCKMKLGPVETVTRLQLASQGSLLSRTALIIATISIPILQP